MKNRTLTLAAAGLIGAALMVTGCSSATKTSSADCLSVPVGKQSLIASRPEAADVGKITTVNAAAYKSPDFKDVYFIAMSFRVVGVDDAQVGVWASNALEPDEGMILAVNSFAQGFTDWPDADKTKADIARTDPAVDMAKGCLS